MFLFSIFSSSDLCAPVSQAICPSVSREDPPHRKKVFLQLCEQINQPVITGTCVRQSSILTRILTDLSLTTTMKTENIINPHGSFTFVLLDLIFTIDFFFSGLCNSACEGPELVWSIPVLLRSRPIDSTTRLYSLDHADQLIMMDFQLSEATVCKILLYYLREW